jgi:hypothetical protein
MKFFYEKIFYFSLVLYLFVSFMNKTYFWGTIWQCPRLKGTTQKAYLSWITKAFLLLLLLLFYRLFMPLLKNHLLSSPTFTANLALPSVANYIKILQPLVTKETK